MSEERRPPAHPAYPNIPSEVVSNAEGDPSLLTDRERMLLLRLAIDNLCRQTGCDEQTAAEALDRFVLLPERFVLLPERFDIQLPGALRSPQSRSRKVTAPKALQRQGRLLV